MINRFQRLLFSIWMPATAILVTLTLFPFMLTRRSARRINRFWARVVLFGLKYICGIDHKISGAENMPQGAALVVANHQSAWETFSLLQELPQAVFVLKKELVDIPFFGWWAKAGGYIAVDREAGASALKVMMQQANRAIKEGAQVVIFPEGSRTKPGKTKDFQPGVAGLYRSLGVPCIPMAHNAGLYWQHPEGPMRKGTISLTVLPAVDGDLKRGPFLDTIQTMIDSQALGLVNLEEQAG